MNINVIISLSATLTSSSVVFENSATPIQYSPVMLSTYQSGTKMSYSGNEYSRESLPYGSYGSSARFGTGNGSRDWSDRREI